MMRNQWATLLEELLFLLLQRTTDVGDFIRFGLVCRSWSVVAAKANYNTHAQLPWLMLDYPQSKDGTFTFLDFATNEVIEIHVPEATGMSNILSSKGWLIKFDHHKREIRLLNPLTRAHARISSVVHHWNHPGLSACCTDHHLAVAALDGIALLNLDRPADDGWKFITAPTTHIFSVAYHKGQFYALTLDHKLLVCDVGEEVEAKIIGEIPASIRLGDNSVLVECCGELLIVVWEKSYGSTAIKVFKLVFYGQDLSVVEVRHLGGQALFMDKENCVAVPAGKGCKGNSIYFAYNEIDMVETFSTKLMMAHFCLDDEKLEIIETGVKRCTSAKWVVPNLMHARGEIRCTSNFVKATQKKIKVASLIHRLGDFFSCFSGLGSSK